MVWQTPTVREDFSKRGAEHTRILHRVVSALPRADRFLAPPAPPPESHAKRPPDAGPATAHGLRAVDGVVGLVLLPLLHCDVVARVVPGGVLVLSPAAAAVAAHAAYHQHHHQGKPSSPCRCRYDDDRLAV